MMVGISHCDRTKIVEGSGTGYILLHVRPIKVLEEEYFKKQLDNRDFQVQRANDKARLPNVSVYP